MPGVSVRKRLGKHCFVSFERSLGQRDWFEQTLSITQSNCLCFSAQRLFLAFSSYSMPFIPGLNEQLATFYSMFYNPRLSAPIKQLCSLHAQFELSTSHSKHIKELWVMTRIKMCLDWDTSKGAGWPHLLKDQQNWLWGGQKFHIIDIFPFSFSFIHVPKNCQIVSSKAWMHLMSPNPKIVKPAGFSCTEWFPGQTHPPPLSHTHTLKTTTHKLVYYFASDTDTLSLKIWSHWAT